LSRTLENLREAFAGESKANRRYLGFAKKAEEEGFPQVAKLFRAVAEAETIHALNHLRVLGEVKSTLENLETAVSGENFEHQKMYPEFISKAEEEGNREAEWSFDVANKVEKVHEKLFATALGALKSGKTPWSVDYYICSFCGNTVEGEPPERCPICGAPKEKFFKAS